MDVDTLAIVTDFYKQIKRIADALERAHPPYDFEYKRISQSSETLDKMRVEGGWQYVEEQTRGLWVLRRPAPAPVEDTEESDVQEGYVCPECGATGKTEASMSAKHHYTCTHGIPF